MNITEQLQIKPYDIDKTFEATYEEYKDFGIHNRPYLPKSLDLPNTQTITNYVKQIIWSKIFDNTNSDKLQNLIYSGAMKTAKLIGKSEKKRLHNRKIKSQYGSTC